MYKDTVTVFNHYKSPTADLWFPSVLKNVDFNSDRATIMSRFGADAKDAATLHVKCDIKNGEITVGAKCFLQPKEWAKLPNDELEKYITFSFGNDFSFFAEGDFGTEIINDDEYPGGFYEYMNSRYDNVFVITSAAHYSVIPHFEILAK